jgi:CubicO group peptidase (beta-lactamase class C family)
MAWTQARSGLLAVLVWGVCTTCLSARGDEREEKFDTYLKARVEVSSFSGSVLVSQGGHVLFERGYGLANREQTIPNSPTTKFRLGSLTKQFTAMAVLMLQEDGKLRVDDPIKSHLDIAPESWDAITIHHLLTHTSGLPNFTSFPDYEPTMREPSPPLKTIARFRDKPLDFVPGEKFVYSNSGYIVLGAIIEKVAGKPYEEVLRERILEPLEMNSTGYDHPETVLAERAAGYSSREDSIDNCAFLDMSIPHAAGALYSTVEDLARWDLALAGRKLLSADSYAAYFQPFKGGYAYGWAVDERFGRKRLGHGGGINGFGTQIDRYPDDDLCVVVLCNLEGLDPGGIARDLAAIVFGEPYELPEALCEVPVDAKLLDDYVGSYEIEEGPTITIVKNDAGLALQGPNGSPARLHASSQTRFFLKVPEGSIEFVKDEQGHVTQAKLTLGRGQLNARKVDAKKDQK